MKRNTERPGLGFPTASNRKAAQPSQASNSAPSLFGLISQVNKGISKQDEKPEDATAIEAAKDAAKQIAEKLAIQNTIQKQQHIQEKRHQFLAAKANVERLFTGGNIAIPQQVQKPQTTTQAVTNIFKVPEPKDSGTGTSGSGSNSDRPGLGFEDGKKSFPKPVGLGRNIFTENENKIKEGKYSLVPYGYDDKEKSDERDESGSRFRSKTSGSSSREDRRFSEEGKKSREKGQKSGKQKEKGNNEETLQDDYFKYGFGKEESNVGAGIPSTYGDPSARQSAMDRNIGSQEYIEGSEYRGGFEDSHYQDDMTDRDVLRFRNEINAENSGPGFYDERDYERNQQYNDDYSGHDFVGPGAVSIGIDPGSLDFGGPPGQPVFLQAVPVNVVPLPLQTMNFEGPGDDYYDERGQYLDDRYPPGDEFRNYDDYDRQYRDNSYSRSPFRDEGYEDDNFQDRYEDNEGFEPGWSDGRHRSLSQDRYGSLGVQDDSRDRRMGPDRRSDRRRSSDGLRSPGRSKQRTHSIDRESGWQNVDPQYREKLEAFDRQMGYSHRSRSRSPERYRHRDRGGSLDRGRRSRSRSEGRSRDGRGSRGGRRGSSGRSPKVVTAAEDAFILGHRAFMEERERKWEELKAQNKNLTNIDKAMHPLFINTHRGGYLCKDCSVTCMDSGEYGIHLLSENHLRVIQLKAQELLLKEKSGISLEPETDKRKSRFSDIIDSTDKSRSHSSQRDRSRDRIRSHDRSRSRGRRSWSRERGRRERGRRSWSRERGRRNLSRERGLWSFSRDTGLRKARSRSRDRRPDSDRWPMSDDIEILDGEKDIEFSDTVPELSAGVPKPYGPLIANNIHLNSLQLSWNKGIERQKNITYLVEYVHFWHDKTEPWSKLGTTTGSDFIVRDLEEDTMYKFRVKSLRGGLESQPLYSRRIRTKSSDPAVQAKRAKAKKFVSAMKRAEQAKFFKKKFQKDISEPLEVTIDLTETTEADNEHKQMIEAKRREGEELKKRREEELRQRFEARRQKMREDWIKGAQIVFYEKLKGETGQLLGLEYVTEIQDYNPSIKPKYRCKLCIASLRDTTVVAHLKGLPHKMKYFEKHNTEIYEKLMLVNDRKVRKSMADKHVQIIQKEKGWGAMNLVRMENPADHDGRVIFTDPVSLPPPEYQPPAEPASVEDVEKEVDSLLKTQDAVRYTTDGEVIRHFDQLLQDAEVQRIKNGDKIEPVLGLQFVVELLHPEMKELPRYQCNLCKSNCAQTNILTHIWGRGHRIAYLRKKHPDVCTAFMSIADKKEMNDTIDIHCQEIEEMIGRETVKAVKSRSTKLWDWAKTVAEKAAKAKAEQEAAETVKTDGIKFDVKAKEQPVSNVQSTNVLETIPSEKEEKDWNTENILVRERINNGSIIKSTRPAKFKTVYSAFFKKFPIVGIQWVTEFQKPDKNDEPWYLCYLCQCKTAWKSILDHLTSVDHRINYMKKSYSNMYNLLMRTTQDNKAILKKKVEEYSVKILNAEPEQKMDVMLELNFTKSLVVAAKEQEKSVGEKPAATATHKPEKKSAALETAFSTGFSAIADNQSDNKPDGSAEPQTFKDFKERAAYKAQLEDDHLRFKDKMQTDNSPVVRPLQSQSGAQGKLNVQCVATNAPIQPALQSQAGQGMHNTQPQVASVPNVGRTRGFSSQQILPGQPILHQPTSINTSLPPPPVQPNIGLVSSAPLQTQQFMPPMVSGPPTRMPRPGFAPPPQGAIRPPPLRGPMNLQPVPTSMPPGSQPWSRPASMPMNQQQFGLRQPNMGAQPANIGVQQQPNIRMQQPNIRVQHPSAGVQQQTGLQMQQMNMGIQQPNMGIQQPNMGVQHLNMGIRPNIGAQQMKMGAQQGPNIGVQQANMGVQQLNMGIRPNMGAQQGPNMGVQQANKRVQQPGSGVDIRPVRPGLNTPRLNQPRVRQPGINGPRFSKPNIISDRPWHDWSKYKWSKIDKEQGGPSNASTTTENNQVTDDRNDNMTDSRTDKNKDNFDKRTDQERGFDRHSDENVKGEKRKDFRSQSPEYQKRPRRSVTPVRENRSRSPGRRVERRDKRDNTDRWRSDHRDQGIRGDTERDRSNYDNSERIPEEGERIVRLLSPRSRRDEERNYRQHRHASEYSRDEADRKNYDSERHYDNPDNTEDQLLEADLELGASGHGRHRSDWDRHHGEQPEPSERYGDRQRERERRSRSPHHRSHYDDRRAQSPYSRRHFEDRRSEAKYRGGSRDRYSDHGRERHLDEDEASGRRSPGQEDIQALLAQVSSTMQMMSEEDRQQMEEELKRNLPQAFPHDEPAQDERPAVRGSGRGGAGPRGYRGGRPPRGRGFQRRGR